VQPAPLEQVVSRHGQLQAALTNASVQTIIIATDDYTMSADEW
jgi:hypothetical protein